MKSKLTTFLLCVISLMVHANEQAHPMPDSRANTLHLSLVHRGGGQKERPDNTLDTFLWCWGNGAAVECDCRRTRDGVGIMLHDSTLKRTARGIPADLAEKNVSEELAWDDIKDVDVGSYIKKLNPSAADYGCCRIPTIEATFAAMKGHPDWLCYVDEKGAEPRYIAAKAREAGVVGQVYFTSMHYYKAQEWIREVPDGKTLMWIGTWPRPAHDATGAQHFEEYVERHMAKIRAGGYRSVTSVQLHIWYKPGTEEPVIPREPYLRKAISELHAHGITVMAMPFEGGEKEETYFKLWDMGFDSFGTDFPSVMFSVISKLRQAESAAFCIPAYTPDVVSRPQLRGVMSPARDMREDDFKTLHEWGATLLRYQMVRDWHGTDTNQDLDEFGRWLDRRLDHFDSFVLPMANKYGIMVVLDLHVPPGGRDSSRDMNMFYEEKYANCFIETWRRLASRFKGRNGIYGYDLINEPVQTRTALPGIDHFGLQCRAAEAVRSEDPVTPIIIESNNWDSPEAFRGLSVLRLTNVIYEVHMYVPLEFTHQNVGKTKQRTVAYPSREKGWNAHFLREAIKPVWDFQKKYGARIYVGEFSAVAWAPGAEKYLEDCIALFDEYGWDWTYHAFREWQGWSVEHEGKDANSIRDSSDNPRKRVLLKGMCPDRTASRG